MFSQVPEKRMLVVRALLLGGWMLLIASMFWDPVTPAFTAPSNLASPFHIKQPEIVIQGNIRLHNVPYSMANRIWWTMLVPLLPMFFMVFGHEAYRRICPLSFASQIPGILRLTRKASYVHRRSGKIESKIALIDPTSWMEKNSWYIQIGLLYAGLSIRLLFVNGNAIALAVFLLTIIGCAVLTGFLFGGKTWCNYFCPVNVVQKIYTEPRGLFESAPHTGKFPIFQSSCRIPGPGGDRSACVGCKPNCGDVDLEKSYWETLTELPRRNAYYIYFGLINGFYFFYFLYSGTWDYYFSGVWTHEGDQMSRLLAPGLYLFGRSIGIPKLLSAPLILAAFAAISLLLGRFMENLYRRYRNRKSKIAEAEVMNHCLSFTAFLCINSFYLFGGRPNLLLQPTPFVRTIDAAIVILSTVWLCTALQRTPFKYRRESLAASLLSQLRKIKVDVSKYMEGRTLDDLQPDEVYVLSKVMPAFSREEKMQAYRKILEEMISSGNTTSAASLQLLQDLRGEMGISEQEHYSILEQLGQHDNANLDAAAVSARERQLSISNYVMMAGRTLVKQVEAGKTLEMAMAEPDSAAIINTLRASFQISDADHQTMIDTMTGPGGLLESRLDEYLVQLKDLQAAVLCMSAPATEAKLGKPFAALLTCIAGKRSLSVLNVSLWVLRSMSVGDAAFRAVRNLASILGPEFLDSLYAPVVENDENTWETFLDPELLACAITFLEGRWQAEESPDESQYPTFSFRDVMSASLDLHNCLKALSASRDPIVLSVVLTAMTAVEHDGLVDVLKSTSGDREIRRNWLFLEVVQQLEAGQLANLEGSAESDRITVALSRSGSETDSLVFETPLLKIGSDPTNDICLQDEGVDKHHLIVQRQRSGLRVSPVGDGGVYVNGEFRDAEFVLAENDRLSFSVNHKEETTLRFTVPGLNSDSVVVTCSTIGKMVALSAMDDFLKQDLHVAAKKASNAEVRRFRRGMTAQPDTIARRRAALVRSGSLELIKVVAGEEISIRRIAPGESLSSQPEDVAIKVVSGFADIVIYDSDTHGDAKMPREKLLQVV